MLVQEVVAPSIVVGGAPPMFVGKNVANAENFADTLRSVVDDPYQKAASIDTKPAEWAAAKKRIAEVGFSQYIREQHEIQKMIRLIELMAMQSAPDIRVQLETIADDLKKDPPPHPQAMYARIEAFIEAIPKNSPNALRQRMEDVYRKLKKMMEEPDAALETLEKSLRYRRLLARAML